MMRVPAALLPLRKRPGGLAVLVGMIAAMLVLGLAFARATAPVVPPVMVQIVATDPAVREAAAAAALTGLRANPAVDAVERIAPADLARMSGAPDAQLPALIEVRIAADADRGAIERAMARIPHAGVQPPAPVPPPSPLHRLAEMIVLLAATGLVGLVALAAALYGENRWGVAVVLRELGASDPAIVRAILQNVAVDVAAGSGGGLAVALLPLVSTGLAGWGDAAGMLAWTVATALLALSAAAGVVALRLWRCA